MNNIDKLIENLLKEPHPEYDKTPDYTVHPYGSSVNGLGFKGCDIDAYVGTENDRDLDPKVHNMLTWKIRTEILHRLQYQKDGKEKLDGIENIPNARVPIIKFLHSKREWKGVPIIVSNMDTTGTFEMYNVLSLTDTLAMINAALSSEKLKKTDEAFKYYKMCADNNYGKGAEMYQSMIRVLNASDSKDEDQILNIIAEGKERFPKDYILNIEEFNYWYTKGNNEKAQLALENAIESDPTNKILHFNIGVTYDNISNKYHDENKHELAFQYMNTAISGYENAIKLDSTYVDAYYNLGALYYNQSITYKSVAGDYSGDKYESEMKKADDMLKKAIPLLERVLSFSPNDKSTLKVLKSLYFNLDDMENYSRIKKQLESL